MTRRKIRFGVIGGGLMGREFASAAARWSHLVGLDFEPEIVAFISLRAWCSLFCSHGIDQ